MKLWLGRCLCGDVSFEANGNAHEVTHCYCSMCRRHGGAGSQTFVRFATSTLRWTGTSPQVFRSSPGAQRGFCGRCGSPLFLDYDDQVGSVWVTAGVLDAADDLKPNLHWCPSDKLRWVPLDTKVPSADPLPVASVNAELYEDEGVRSINLKIGTASFEINVLIPPSQVAQFAKVRETRWEDGSLQIGTLLGLPVHWSNDNESVSVLAGHDDQTWEFGTTLRLEVLDQIASALDTLALGTR